MTRVPVNDLARELDAERQELQAALNRVIGNGWLVHGPEHAAFEAEFAAFVGGGHAVGVASGTDALILALRAALDGHGGRVATVANAGGYSTTAATIVGAPVTYVDVDPSTHVMSPSALEASLTGDVRVVIVTHLYGRLADMDAISALCQARDVILIEDCAQSVGAVRNGRSAGAWGDFATFSFYPTKNLGALGDGGLIICRSEEGVHKVRQLRQYGWATKYRVARRDGQNSRLDELQAAFLRTRLPRVQGWNATRRAIIQRYADSAPASIRVLPATGSDHAAHLAVVETADASDLARHLMDHEVANEVHYPIPDHLQPAWHQQQGWDLPVTEHLMGRILTLPCFPMMTADEQDQVCAALASYDGAAAP